ncbi:MAG: hypothetical protein JNJ73_12180 [Hyphomonadaceae bacterium]|nr:hypothetical protein [Hyphomonadaceae bacterium]
MKALLVSLAAFGAMAATSVSAHAAPGDGYGRGYERTAYMPGHEYGERSGFQLQRIEERLRIGVRTGAINRWEARRLFGQLAEVRDMRAHFLRTRGIDRREAMILQDRIQDLRVAVRIESNDRDFRRYDRF